MADNKKNRKPLSSRNKGLIVLAVMLVLTICVSWISVTGIRKDAAGINVLRPWLPLTAGSFDPDNARSVALTVDVGLGGGQYNDYAYVNTPAPTAEPTAEPEATEAPAATAEPEAGTGNAETEATAVPEATAEPTASPVPTAAPSDVEKAAAVIRSRIASTGYAAEVSVVGGNVRVTYPNYINANTSEDAASLIQYLATATGLVEVADDSGSVIVSNDAFTSYKIDYMTGSDGTGYYRAVIGVTADARKTLDALGDGTYFVNLDGNTLTYLSYVYNGGRFYMAGTTETEALRYGAIFTNDPLPVSAVRGGTYDAPASGGLLNVLLIVMWALFLAAAVYMIVRNRMAGLGGAWALWLFMVFMFFLIATVAMPVMTVLNWIAVILCLLCAAYCAVYQLKGMDDAMLQGRDARGAVRAGFNATVKHVMIVHGIWFCLSLLLMILAVTRPFGNILCCGVLASLVSVVGLMRWFVPCLVSVADNGKGSVSAKAGK